MEEAQFDGLHRTLANEVYRYAARRTSHDLAQDVVAEVFVALWRGRDRIPNLPEEQRAWVFGIARRQLARAQAAEDRHRRIGMRLRAALVGGVPVSEDDVAINVLDMDEARRLWRMLRPREQEVLALTVWEQLAPQEVAAVLGLTITAVTSRLHRARTRLAALQHLHGMGSS